jgi:tetratricopeptide (TPR) repeat protein
MPKWAEYSEEELVRIGREALRSLRFERARDALAEYVERLQNDKRPVPAGALANYALALGHTSGTKEGLAVCKAALKSNRRLPEVYYCLAQLYLLTRSRKQAFEALREGLARGPEHAGLVALQAQMGVRRKGPVPFLHRDNALNVRLGKALRRGKGGPRGPSGAAV